MTWWSVWRKSWWCGTLKSTRSVHLSAWFITDKTHLKWNNTLRYLSVRTCVSFKQPPSVEPCCCLKEFNWGLDLSLLRKVLKESTEIRSDINSISPLSELHYWKKFSMKFDHIMNHINSQECQAVKMVLNRSNSKIMKVKGQAYGWTCLLRRRERTYW